MKEMSQVALALTASDTLLWFILPGRVIVFFTSRQVLAIQIRLHLSRDSPVCTRSISSCTTKAKLEYMKTTSNL